MKNPLSSLRVRQTLAAVLMLLLLLVVLDELDKASPAPPSKKVTPSLHVASVTQMEAVEQVPSLLQLGYVEPLKVTEVMSDVSGRIVSLSEHFRKGRILNASSALLQIDPLPYQVAVANAKSQRLEAKTALKNVQTQYDANSLVVQAAKSQLELAELQLKQAQIDLQRTTITLPFSGELVEIKASLGEYVAAGSSIAAALEHAKREIRVPINIMDFNALQQPLLQTQVAVYSVDHSQVWQAQITGVSQYSENQQRTLYISIADAKALPLFGENVYVKLPHKNWQQNTFSVPESALTEKYEIWLVNQQNRVFRHKLDEFTLNNERVYFPMAENPYQHVVQFPRSYLSQGMELAIKEVDSTEEAL